jgi:hypothetical protein
MKPGVLFDRRHHALDAESIQPTLLVENNQ